MQISFSPDEIAAIVRPGRTSGATSEKVRGIAGLKDAAPGDLSFLGNPKYSADVASTRASVVLLPAGHKGSPPAGQLWMLVDNPSVALARLCARIEQSLWPKPKPGIHATASVAAGATVDPEATVGPLCVVESGAKIGARTHLQAQVFVGRGARVGDDCWLAPGTVVAAECELGNRVRLQPGAIVGSDGFGYEWVENRHEKVPQVGTVVIHDDVEIGANTTIDRARFSRTVVGEGSKIDNLVQIAHNVVIGRHCMICAQVGISGSTTLEDGIYVGGQVGFVGHITIGRGAKIGAQSGVSRDVPAGASVFGSPAITVLLEQKLTVLRGRLPELFKRVASLEEQLGGPK